MTLFESKSPWDAKTEAWLLKSLARGVSQAVLYRQLIGEVEGLPVDITVCKMKYRTFRSRIRKLTAQNSRIVRGQHQQRRESTPDADIPSPVDNIESPQGMLVWLKRFISGDSRAKSGDRLRALTMLREIQDDLAAPDDDDTPTLTEIHSRGKEILADPIVFVAIVGEQLDSAIEEKCGEWVTGALYDWMLAAGLPIIQDVIQRLQEQHPTLLDQLKVRNESKDERIERLQLALWDIKNECNNLSEAEQQSIVDYVKEIEPDDETGDKSKGKK